MPLFKKRNTRKIDFIVIGTQKGGTSAIHHYLRQHPEVGLPKTKELHFFDDEKIFSGSPVNYLEYERKFDFDIEKKVYGETTPIYMYWEPCCKRIWEYNKNIKLIATLRNPIERAFSHWNMEIQFNTEKEDFLYCVKNELQRSKEALPYQHRHYSYTDRGFYAIQIRRLLRFFSEDQLLFIKYEDFKQNQYETMHKIFKFLDINAEIYQFQPKAVNPTNYSKKMTQEEKNYLIELFQNDVSEAERLLGWDCQDWLQ